jgi:hypothetical protein
MVGGCLSATAEAGSSGRWRTARDLDDALPGSEPAEELSRERRRRTARGGRRQVAPGTAAGGQPGGGLLLWGSVRVSPRAGRRFRLRHPQVNQARGLSSSLEPDCVGAQSVQHRVSGWSGFAVPTCGRHSPTPQQSPRLAVRWDVRGRRAMIAVGDPMTMFERGVGGTPSDSSIGSAQRGPASP